jgi:hypothetical protein
MTAPRGIGTLRVLMGALIVSTAIHYTDNAVAVDEYPGTEPGGAVGVPLFWLGFTIAGLIGYRLYTRGREPLAQVLIGVFAYSGISSIGHYLYDGMDELATWQNVSVLVDIALGSALLAWVIWSLATRRRLAAAQQT